MSWINKVVSFFVASFFSFLFYLFLSFVFCCLCFVAWLLVPCDGFYRL